MAYRGSVRPKGIPFFRLQVCERVVISLVKVYEMVGKSAHKDAFLGCKKKSRKRSGFVI